MERQDTSAYSNMTKIQIKAVNSSP